MTLQQDTETIWAATEQQPVARHGGHSPPPPSTCVVQPGTRRWPPSRAHVVIIITAGPCLPVSNKKLLVKVSSHSLTSIEIVPAAVGLGTNEGFTPKSSG